MMERSNLESFSCNFCGPAKAASIGSPFCPVCRAPLLAGPARTKRAFRWDRPIPIDVFRDYLPLAKIDPTLTLGEGDTPLIELGRIASRCAIPGTLWAKNEAANPTGSFKDRGSVVAVHKAVELGFKTIGTISTGNMAGSTAAYAAKAGLRSVIFVKEDTGLDKIRAAGIYGPLIVKVRGDYGALFQKSFEIGRKRKIYFMNSVDPYRIEGYKVTGYEIFDQRDGRGPDCVFVPVSAGGHLIGLMRAFEDLRAAGYLEKTPRFVGVQAKGCAPIARAFALGKTEIKRFPNPQTIAHAISNPKPPGGNLVLRLIAQNGGMMESVSDDEIVRAQRLLAEYEGIFCDPASATVLAAVFRLARRKEFSSRDRLVLVITGSGLKTLEDLDLAEFDVHEAGIDDLESVLPDRLSVRK